MSDTEEIDTVIGNRTNRPAKNQRPMVHCVCGTVHMMSPTAMAIVISAFLGGDLQTMGPNGDVRSKCILKALDMSDYVKLYPGRSVNVL